LREKERGGTPASQEAWNPFIFPRVAFLPSLAAQATLNPSQFGILGAARVHPSGPGGDAPVSAIPSHSLNAPAAP
jgi:hypothetical protein